ncbi:MAG: D-alanyl-D-alanine carboxypeptidase [Myxococcota bacterium]
MALLIACSIASLSAPAGAASWEDEVRSLAGSKGVVYVLSGSGQPLLQLGTREPFIPASTLKIVTGLLAAEYLGLDSHFETHFWIEPSNAGDLLVVKGFGDPFLVSEELDRVAEAVKASLPQGQTLAGVAIDDSYFAPDITIPGVGRSDNPYDALNSAVAVNFNTVHVQRSKGKITSAEPQTPLTPLARRVARQRGVKGKERINLSSRPEDVRRYAAELIAAKLRGVGVSVGDHFETRRAPGRPARVVHASSKSVGDCVGAMLYYSNNYVANQVFLAIGAQERGAPATLAKGVAVANEFLDRHSELSGIVMTEGSGISYDNRVTGPALAGALSLFTPYKHLLREKHGSPNKTGTLKVTKTVAGYLDTREHGTVRYVISLGGGGAARRWKIVDVLRKAL